MNEDLSLTLSIRHAGARFTWDGDEPAVWDVLEWFKQGLLAVGYGPGSVARIKYVEDEA